MDRGGIASPGRFVYLLLYGAKRLDNHIDDFILGGGFWRFDVRGRLGN